MQGWNNEIKEKVKVRRPERNHEAYNKSGLLNLGWTSLDNIITIWAYDG